MPPIYISCHPATRLVEFIRKRAWRVIVQQGVEDMFNSVKHHNGKKSNTVCTEQFAMSMPIDDRLLSTKHHYK